jgi:hypothetical protein
VEIARDFMEAFSRPPESVSQARWWAKVRPFLTDEAADELEWVDRRQVPFSKVKSAVFVRPSVEEESHLAVTVDVETDDGTWQIRVQVLGELSVSGFDAPSGGVR